MIVGYDIGQGNPGEFLGNRDGSTGGIDWIYPPGCGSMQVNINDNGTFTINAIESSNYVLLSVDPLPYSAATIVLPSLASITVETIFVRFFIGFDIPALDIQIPSADITNGVSLSPGITAPMAVNAGDVIQFMFLSCSNYWWKL